MLIKIIFSVDNAKYEQLLDNEKNTKLIAMSVGHDLRSLHNHA